MPGSTRAPELPEVLDAVIESGSAVVRVSMPGMIVKWDESKQMVDVKPLLKRAFYDEEDNRQVESLAIITNVPVIFPGGGGFRLTFPIHASNTDGDICELTFSDSSLDKWLSGKGQEVDPGIDHTHNISDAVAHVALKPFGAPWTSCDKSEATLGSDTGVQLHMAGGVIAIGDKPSTDSSYQYIAMAQKVLDELNAIKSAFSAHTHAAGTLSSPSGPVTGATAVGPTYSPGSVAATQGRVK